MKIAVNSEEKRINLRFPSFLIFNPLVATIGSKALNSFINDKTDDVHISLSAKDVRKLFKEINKARRKYKDWYIVDIVDSDGETVKIKL